MASRRVFSQAKESLIQEAFKTLSLDSPEIRLDDFVATTLGLNASQRATAFMSTDPSTASDPNLVLDSLAGLLDTCRRNILSREARIPKAVLVKREDQALGRSDYAVAGLQTYLRQASEPDSFVV